MQRVLHWAARWRRRLHVILHAREAERTMDAEMHDHIEREIEYRVQLGMSVEEARRSTLRDFGGIERYKEEGRDARGTRWIEDLAADTIFAARALRQRPGFTIVAILTLAVGIGGTTAVFSAVDAVLLQPLPYQQPGQLVRLYQGFTGQTNPTNFVTPVHFLAYRRELSSFEGLAALGTYSEDGADLGTGSDARRIRLLPVSADYFGVVRVQPVLGRGFQPQDENGSAVEDGPVIATNVVVLSHSLWERQFQGDPGAVGRTLVMSGVPYTVVGVMPDGYVDPIVGAVDAWVPFNLAPGRDLSNTNNHYLTVIGRLRSGVTLPAAQAELETLGRALVPRLPSAGRDIWARLVPLKEDIVGSASRALRLMLGAVGLVLLLVCVNVSNLLLVRGSERARELALRSALGADRGRVVRQLLAESLLLALAGGVAGLLVARLAMSAIVALGAGSIPRLDHLSLDPALLAFALGVTTACALLFGTIPALRASRTDPAELLRAEGRSATGGVGHVRLRSGLVVAQVALAFVLLSGAGALLASFSRLREVNLGFRGDHVLTFELALPEARYDSTARARFYEELAKRVEQLPGVRAAGGVSKLPATGSYNSWGTEVESGPKVGARDFSDEAENRVVSGDYFRALGVQLLEGRVFDARDDAAAPSRLVISKSAADRFYPGVDPVGQIMSAGRDHHASIIGVVADVALDAEGAVAPTIYHAHRKFAGERVWTLMQAVATDSAPERVTAAVRQLLARMDPQLVMYHPTPLDEVIGRGTADRLFTLRMLLAFAAIALGLAAIGVFGALSYTVTLRAREFGIRMALGAEAGRIAGLVLRQGLTISVMGTVLGLAGAAAASRVLASLVFRTSPLDPRLLGASMLVMWLVAGLAAYLPARRATGADPLTALRSE